MIEEDIERLRDRMEQVHTEKDIKKVLLDISKQFISLEMFEKTGIGNSLSRLHRRCPSEELRIQTREMLNEWKSTATIAADRRKRKAKVFAKRSHH